jgi:hypothetical protein
MMFLRTSLCALFVLCCLLLSTPNSARAKVSPRPAPVKDEQWRPISAAELAQKAPIVETDADAEYQLYEVRLDDTDDTDLSLKYYVRVKIFTERGRDKYSKIDIVGSPNSKIKDVAARVTKPDGTSVELAPTDIFERTIVKVGSAKIKARSFAVPGIGPGVIVEYRYKEKFEDASAQRPLDFQKEIPVQVMTYAIRPNTNTFSTFEKHQIPDDVSSTKEKDNYQSYTMHNVPAFHEEPYMPPIREIRPWMTIHYGIINIFSSGIYWGTKGSARFKALKDLTKANDDVKRMAAQLTNGAATPEDKIAKIYDFCHTQVKNIGYDTAMSDEERSKVKENKSPGDTLKRLQGTSIEIELLFASLAKASGLDATLTWTADRSERFFQRSMNDDDMLHVAGVAVKIGALWKFFNPSARFVPYGMLIWYEEGQEAFIPVEDGVVWSKTPISDPEKTREIRTAKFKLLEDGTLEGEVRIEFTGQFATTRKGNNYDDSATQQEETLKDEIKARLSTAELTDIKVENANDPTNPFVYNFKIRVPGYAAKTGKRLFLQPGFFEHGNGAAFTASDRKYDMYFHYPWSEEETTTIELPAGYLLDGAEKPAPITPEMTQGICGLNIGIGISNDKKTLTYKRSFFFGGKGVTIFPVANYQAVKRLFDMVHQADDHTIVLRQQ